MHWLATDRLNPKTLILTWDTGASAGLTPFRSDFTDYVECEIDVHVITKVNKVVGIGTTLYKFMDNNSNHVYLPCVSYHSNEVVMKFCKKGASGMPQTCPSCTILSCLRRSRESKPPSSGLLFMQLGFMQRLTTLPTCQSTKICQCC
jgi:hypothetical protein